MEKKSRQGVFFKVCEKHFKKEIKSIRVYQRRLTAAK